MNEFAGGMVRLQRREKLAKPGSLTNILNMVICSGNIHITAKLFMLFQSASFIEKDLESDARLDEMDCRIVSCCRI